ncbi:MAG: hypothetical protein J0L58_16835 [Burkholderiales bacterium]|nr:hypothetical protein [Burkholderiales bacterium]
MAGNAATAGAQIGAQFGPWGAAIGAGVGAVTELGAQALGGSVGAPAHLDGRGLFDGSGWTVATGGSSARGGDRSGGIDQGGYRALNPAAAVPAVFGWDESGAAAQALQPLQAGMSPAVLLVLGGLALWAIL